MSSSSSVLALVAGAGVSTALRANRRRAKPTVASSASLAGKGPASAGVGRAFGLHDSLGESLSAAQALSSALKTAVSSTAAFVRSIKAGKPAPKMAFSEVRQRWLAAAPILMNFQAW